MDGDTVPSAAEHYCASGLKQGKGLELRVRKGLLNIH